MFITFWFSVALFRNTNVVHTFYKNHLSTIVVTQCLRLKASPNKIYRNFYIPLLYYFLNILKLLLLLLSVRSPKSWEFLLRLLLDSNSNPRMIRWEDKQEGSFRLVMKDEIARIWGMRTEKHKKMGLSYDNFARNLRWASHYATQMAFGIWTVIFVDYLLRNIHWTRKDLNSLERYVIDRIWKK